MHPQSFGAYGEEEEKDDEEVGEGEENTYSPMDPFFKRPYKL